MFVYAYPLLIQLYPQIPRKGICEGKILNPKHEILNKFKARNSKIKNKNAKLQVNQIQKSKVKNKNDKLKSKDFNLQGRLKS